MRTDCPLFQTGGVAPIAEMEAPKPTSGFNKCRALKAKGALLLPVDLAEPRGVFAFAICAVLKFSNGIPTGAAIFSVNAEWCTRD